jgi:hypothetical protein
MNKAWNNMIHQMRRDHLPYYPEEIAIAAESGLNELLQANESDYSHMISGLTEIERAHLIRVAGILSEIAVRKNDPHLIVLGLLGVGIEEQVDDYRHSLVTLCMLHHSAVKLGVDATELFNRACSRCSDKSKAFILGYLSRGDKRLSSFMLEEWDDAGVFRYGVTG